jgi:hypothetical protein
MKDKILITVFGLWLGCGFTAITGYFFDSWQYWVMVLPLLIMFMLRGDV